MGGRSMGGNPIGGQPLGGDYGHVRHGEPPPNGDQPSTVSSMRGGLQLGPPGRWWDDKHFAKDLKLRPDQQKHMDSIFEQNRPALLKRYEELMQEQDRMEALTHAKTLDENALFAQIDRVAQARAALEKANTHLLYQLRAEMDADQVGKLEQHR
jgi:Spy/CpxP family protein refolding chaperone